MESIWIDREGVIHNYGFKEYSYQGMTVYVDGLIYAYGKKAGEETICWMCESFRNSQKVPFERLRGAFSCIVKYEGSLIMFTDNSNMHCLYYSKDFVSNSFLTLAKQEIAHGKKIEFNTQALCEYYTLGNIYFEKTFFNEIKILSSNKIIIYEKGLFQIIDKEIDGIDGNSEVKTISEFFDRFAYSVSDMKVCQALTGGYDSRLIYSCLSNRIPDHVAISSNRMDDPDVKRAKAVAEANGSELEVISIKKPLFSQKLVDSLFIALDGIQPIDIEADVRLFTFKERLAKKYDLHLTGDGGVLHKDWEWIQDFPFYKRKRSNAKKFYLQRIYYIRNDDHLGNALKPSFIRQQPYFIKKLKRISKSINTQSYDSWYYLVSGNRRVGYNNNIFEGFTSYAPLNEIDLVRLSYALPRFERFFYNSMRKTMTTENLEIARLATNYGTTASSELPYLIRDCFFQTIEYSRKGIRLFSRKILNKTILNNNVLDWDFKDEIQNSSISEEAVIFAKDKQYIMANLSINDLSYAELQRLIHIHWLTRYLGI